MKMTFPVSKTSKIGCRVKQNGTVGLMGTEDYKAMRFKRVIPA